MLSPQSTSSLQPGLVSPSDPVPLEGPVAGTQRGRHGVMGCRPAVSLSLSALAHSASLGPELAGRREEGGDGSESR